MNERESKLLEQFTVIKKDLMSWGEYVDEQLKLVVLKDLIAENLVKMLPDHRVKEPISFLIKAFYRRKPYKNPLVEIEDKIGTRIVLLKSDDIAKASDAVLRFEGWRAKVTKDLKSGIEEKPREFDYQSFHIVVWPNDDYSFQGDKEILSCEIQIRTLLQHAFAEISHDSAYKGPYKNDVGIIRALAKSMALMEATDEYFGEIFSLMSDQSRKVANYTNELIRLFRLFMPTFDRHNLDIELTNNVFDLLNQRDIEIPTLETFVEKNKIEISRALVPQNGIIFLQPASLLLAYYLFNNRTFIEDNWPLNSETRVQLFQAFNISSGNY